MGRYHELIALREKFLKHKHCAYCGKPFDPSNPGETLCSPECRAAMESLRRRESMMRWVMMGMLMILLLILLFLPMLIRK